MAKRLCLFAFFLMVVALFTACAATVVAYPGPYGVMANNLSPPISTMDNAVYNVDMTVDSIAADTGQEAYISTAGGKEVAVTAKEEIAEAGGKNDAANNSVGNMEVAQPVELVGTIIVFSDITDPVYHARPEPQTQSATPEVVYIGN
ncbi:MAG: hypothetical protein WCS88_04380 [Patescibacteria group bacterium]|jgi:hypothetical protein